MASLKSLGSNLSLRERKSCAVWCAACCILSQSAQATRTSRMLRSICAARDCSAAGSTILSTSMGWNDSSLSFSLTGCFLLLEASLRSRKERVCQEMQCERTLRERQADRVHEEGHVIVHHLDDGVRRGKSVLAHGGVEYPYQGGPAPLAREHQVRQCAAGQLRRLA